MLYHFFHDLNIEMPGVGLWSYISFRAGLALILSLFISTIIGKRIIDYLKLKQMGELVRNLGLEGEFRHVLKKEGFNIDDIYELDPDAGLGNGGLGRLASCYMDSLTEK